jgi:hypothetical protein
MDYKNKIGGFHSLFEPTDDVKEGYQIYQVCNGSISGEIPRERGVLALYFTCFLVEVIRAMFTATFAAIPSF